MDYRTVKQDRKRVVKKGRRIVGFAGVNGNRPYYAFGRPSQSAYISFECDSVESGVEKIIENDRAYSRESENA